MAHERHMVMLAVQRAGYISNLELRAAEGASITKTNRQSGVEDPANWPAKPVQTRQLDLPRGGGSKDCRAAQVIGRTLQWHNFFAESKHNEHGLQTREAKARTRSNDGT